MEPRNVGTYMRDTEDNLAQQLVNTDSSALLKKDMDKLLAISTAPGNDERDNLKAEAFNRILLLLGSGNATISGTSYDPETSEFISQTRQASDIDMPIGMYMSGHMGRNYMHFPGTQAKQVLDWVAGEGGIHQKAYSFADNQEKQLQGGEIIFDRHAATHSAQYKKDQVKELKGATYGIAGFLGRIANPRTLGTMDRYTPLRWLTYPLSLTACTVYNAAALVGNVFGAKLPFANPLAKNSEHFGFNVAIGGKGSKYESDPTKEISSDGRSGHVYLNVKGNLMGVGAEAAAPNTEGPLGGHSKTGGADRFTPGENEKFAIKFKSGMFKTYIKDYLSAKKIENTVLQDYLAGKKVKDKDLIAALKECGLNVVKQGGARFLLTNFGTNLAQGNPSVVLPNNYNGFRIDNYNQDNLNQVLGVRHIPKEICYFKPQEDMQSLMKQAVIFKDIGNKPLLRSHPELSLEACVKIGSLYNIANDENAPGKEAARAKLAEIEAAISSREPSKSVKEIVENHPVLKSAELNEVFKAYQQDKTPYQDKPESLSKAEPAPVAIHAKPKAVDPLEKRKEQMFTIIAEGTLGTIAPNSNLSQSEKRAIIEKSAESICEQFSQSGLLLNVSGSLKRQIQDVIYDAIYYAASKKPITPNISLSTALEGLQNKQELGQVAQNGLARRVADICSHHIQLAEQNPPKPAKPVEQPELQKKKTKFAKQVVEPSSEAISK